MQETVVSFFNFAGRTSVLKPCVEAMERGILHVDAVNSLGNTLGIVLSIETNFPFEFQHKYWLRYWALKPSVQKFWTVLINYCPMSCLETVLLKTAGIAALWEDLSFIYNLAAGDGNRLAWVLPELDRRVSASLRLAWIAAAVVW